MQYRTLQEMAVRYASLGVVKRLTPLLEGADGRFPEHAQEIATWREQGATNAQPSQATVK